MDAPLLAPPAHLAGALSALTAAGYLSPDPRGGPGSELLRYTGPIESPAAAVSLRAIDPDQFVIVDEGSNKVLEEIESRKAFYQVYDGAIYLFQVIWDLEDCKGTGLLALGSGCQCVGSACRHWVWAKGNPGSACQLTRSLPPRVPPAALHLVQGRSYYCKQLDLGQRVALVRKADVRYYTRVRDYTDVHVTGGRRA